MVSLQSEFHPDSSVVAEVRASPNHNERAGGARPNMLVLHYTGMPDAESAIRRLCFSASEVSAHYVVREDGYIVQCVPESRRAWHAGQSAWEGETDINSCSIGIEIVNPGHDNGYPDFPTRQISALIMLCRSIFTRLRIAPERVLAHSVVAPGRKRDPGEKFPWRTIHQSGIGLWVKPAPIVPGPVHAFGENNPAIAEFQEMLSRYGYAVTPSGHLDGATRDVIAAFQRHFRREKIDGAIDVSTLETLRALLALRL